MSKPFDLLSILATHQWNTKINLNFFFLGFHLIVEIYQVRIDNWIKPFNPNKINKLCFGVSHQNNRSLNFEISLLGFIEIIGNFLYNFFFNGLYILTSKSSSIISSSLISPNILISSSSSIAMPSLISSKISIFFSLTST